MAELETWLSLVHTRGLGPKLTRKLLAGFGSVDAIASASNGKLASVGLPQKVIKALNEVDQALINADLQWQREGDDRHIITLDSAGYPTLLKEIADPPIVLFVRGDVDVLQTPQLAIVGSRKPGLSARRNAQTIASEITGYGITITSGLALGVDACAHRGALDNGGLTIAVTATGLDRVYPADHQALAHEIAASGAIISEFPIGTNPLPAYFPRRNRIISGLCYGTLVVEAAVKSGTLTTAAHATEQSREVFAIPGNIDNPQARGSHELLRAGATLVESSADILRQLAPVLPRALEFAEDKDDRAPADVADLQTTRDNHTTPEPAPEPTTDSEPGKLIDSGPGGNQAALLAAVEFEALSVDELVDITGMDIVTVTNMTLDLELRGDIVAVAGGRYMKYSATDR